MPPDWTTVRVPATTANLGPGFDCLGIALELYNTVHLALSDNASVDVEGEGAAFLPRSDRNLVSRAVQALYRELGQPTPSVAIRCRNCIPMTRGLGSSAAAVAGGLVAANSLAGGPLPQDRILALAAEMEGHPDNVAAALLGGCQIVVRAEENLRTASVPLATGLKLVLFIPEGHVSTRQARSILPRRVGRQEAVFNIGRVSLLVNALTLGRWEDLETATQDRLHQPFRRSLFPAMEALFSCAREAGAHGAFLSGAGPAVAALATENAESIGEAMEEMARRWGVDGRSRVVAPSAVGAQVLED